ncbi:MAG TPA: penicillin-binding protein 1C [Prolixibacteraceae bacterium]|nr:penicillin-binding protein 1C [Prolixibacteraceae bacterium]HPL45202.1 penicillin-binding protein 1C [Prolixibacteraceae bacterium]
MTGHFFRKRLTRGPAAVLIVAGASLLTWFFFCVPRPLFPGIYSPVLESSDGQLLGARIASDGQWRFPSPGSPAPRFETSLLTFEDRWFYYHPGINPVSLMRALVQNVTQGKIVSGGSTLTMQVARLARPGKARTLANKLLEMIWALNLELRFSKADILKMYVSQAPFGGNVVGLEAAAWRYYQRPPHQLSWAESATLAVLPNAPSLIFPGKNDRLLREKRNLLLGKMHRRGFIDSLTYELSLEEPLPGKVFTIPDHCYHLLEFSNREKPGTRVRTTLDYHLQQFVNEALLSHERQLSANHIYNCCALVAEVGTSRVLAYAGNVPRFDDPSHGNHVDVIRSPRSSGSILKPFLYAAMTDGGMVAPNQLIADIPVRFTGFSPVNFSGSYDGAVPASEALARSLNVPAVVMLQKYGVEPFYHFLKKAGMTTLTKPAGHYGLSLILGGAETTLWDLAGMYASLARIVTVYAAEDGFYPVNPFAPLVWKEGETADRGPEAVQPFLRASAAWLTLEALQKVNRPEEETGWEAFADVNRIAWKTGTSIGFRDGWAVGVTPRHVVAVWAGNGDGEGRPGLTGTAAAAPLMFEIFGFLSGGGSFAPPSEELVPVAFCRQSGYLPSPLCDETDTILVPAGIRIPQCPYHRQIYLDKTRQFRVSEDCFPVSEMITRRWFVLPPAMDYFYRRSHPAYQPLPPVMPGCQVPDAPMELIYPREMERIFIPRQLDGTPGQVIFEMAHRDPAARLFWYVDRSFAAETVTFHQLSLHPEAGWHTVTVTDHLGNLLEKRFFVVDREDEQDRESRGMRAGG